MDNIQQNIPRANLKKKNIARLVLYSELSKYYTMEEIDQMLATISEGGFVDLRSYLKKSEIDSELSATSELPVQNKAIYQQLRDLAETLANYQEKLVSGENIKTINNQSILGEGNIDIQGGGGVDQIQSDWNQTDDTKKDYIKNKPLIPTPIDIDPIPTKNSQNAVASGGVYDAIDISASMTNDDGTAMTDYTAGTIFYTEDEDSVKTYHIAKADGSEGDDVTRTGAISNFLHTPSSVEAVRYSLVILEMVMTRDEIGSQKGNINGIASLDQNSQLIKEQLPAGVVTEYATFSEIEGLFQKSEQQEVSGEHGGEVSNEIGDTPIRDN